MGTVHELITKSERDKRSKNRMEFMDQLIRRLRIPGENDELSEMEFMFMRAKCIHAVLSESQWKNAIRMWRRNTRSPSVRWPC